MTHSLVNSTSTNTTAVRGQRALCACCGSRTSGCTSYDGHPGITQGSTTPAGEMPIMAGEDVRLHDAVQFWESAQAALAHAGLLKAAMGMEPDDAKQIVDLDLNQLHALAPEHPQYYRQVESILRIKTQNKSNRIRRYAIVMKQRTDVYTMFYKSAEAK